ncbi:FGGY-family carbohydrate kinase [Sulfodiicoccus acidiphilus]|uniref:FGGY-family carbohydrate kinase n=1 Tax=Sulfodiicoccus acidiphilus TaxID=1670455 RepID=UPI00131545A2|nr:FGGY-family carbohydrate kinase [Sulfodiicoccus acidiphilus]
MALNRTMGEFLDGDLHLLPPLVSPEHWVELYGKALSIGTVDSVAAALGSVGIEGKEGFASMGSTLCLGVPSRSPSKVPGIYNDLYFDDLFLPNGCNSQFSDVLDKVRELLGEDIDVENVDLRPGLPLLLPFLKGERSPFMDPKAAGVLFGLSWETSRSDVMRAAVHSMAYMEAMMISTLQSESEFNSVRSGGGASFSSLLRLCASLTGIPHFKLRYSPSSLGAALVAGNSIGTLTYRRITEVLPEPSSKIDPDPSLSSHLEYYRLFQSLYYTLRPLFRGP